MAVVRLKNSVEKGKAPAGSALQIGELCINAHEDSPFLSFKDKTDIVHLIKPGASVGNGPTPPPNGNDTGDLWWDGDNLLVWDGSDWVPVGSALWEEDGDAITPKNTDALLQLESGPGGTPTMVWGSKDSTGPGGELTYDSGYKYWEFNAIRDEPDGAGDHNVRIYPDRGEVKADLLTVSAPRSSDWDTDGSPAIEVTNYSENTFSVTTAGDVEIRKSLTIGDIGTSGARGPGSLILQTHKDDASNAQAFSINKEGESSAILMNYSGTITAKTFDLEALDPLPA